MKQAMTINDVASELNRQLATKHDYIVPAGEIRIEATDNDHRLEMLFGEHRHGITKNCHQQIADRLGIPRKYYERCKESAPELLAENCNHWLAGEEKRLVRTLDGNSRAFLSNRYRRLDNMDFVNALLPAVMECGAEIRSANVTEDNLHVKLVVPGMVERIMREGAELGKGSDQYDEVQAGLVLTNSETGSARLAIQPAIHHTGCTNMAIYRATAVKRSHIGSRAGDGEQGDDFKYLSDETRQQSDKALWMQLADLARASLDGRVFKDLCDKLRVARGLVVHKPVEAIEELTKQNGLFDTDKDGILGYLVNGGDLTLYGVHSAVTRYSQDVDDYDRATELELLGGQLIEQAPAYITAK